MYKCTFKPSDENTRSGEIVTQCMAALFYLHFVLTCVCVRTLTCTDTGTFLSFLTVLLLSQSFSMFAGVDRATVVDKM